MKEKGKKKERRPRIITKGDYEGREKGEQLGHSLSI